MGAPKETDSGGVLVVDDDYGVRFALRTLLQKEGYKVSTAADGSDALARLRSAHFDLLLVDLELPIVDGYAVIEQMKTEQPELPIIVITAHASMDSISRVFTHRVSGFISKPFKDNADVVTKVGNVLSLKRARSDAASLFTQVVSGREQREHKPKGEGEQAKDLTRTKGGK